MTAVILPVPGRCISSVPARVPGIQKTRCIFILTKRNYIDEKRQLYTIMQLPRGTFREIKKGIPVSALLDDLEKTGFSGLCSLSFEGTTGTLVLKSGKCILADFMGHHGDAAWNDLQTIMQHDVDAALSSLDEAQIQLSIEFNKSARIVKPATSGGKSSHHPSVLPHTEPEKKPVAHHHQTPPQPPVKTPPRSATPPVSYPPERAPVHRPETVVSHKHPAVQPAPATSPPAQPAGKTDVDANQQEEPDMNSFDQDIDTFDSMDLENVTDKIRSDCKTMIKQLHLEHLMER
jgi:hypothetical protein